MLDFTWESVNDSTVRPEHRDLSSGEPYQHSYTPIWNCRCFMVPYSETIKRALRTYPKRMSRAKRKEARARERRRVERYNQWWSQR